jgi:hypothetical protein
MRAFFATFAVERLFFVPFEALLCDLCGFSLRPLRFFFATFAVKSFLRVLGS